jgi:SurA-like protein
VIPVPPPPESLPANVVAIVAQVPDRAAEQGGVTTTKEFHHALVQVAAERRQLPAPKPGDDAYPGLQHMAIDQLLDDSWIRGQAAEMGIGVRPRGVSRELAALKKKAFENGAQYRQFLKEAHFTRRDVRDRVEVQMLSEQIQVTIVAGLTSARSRQRAFGKFVKEYEERWRARTVCASGHVTVRCSNGPTPETLARVAVFRGRS